MNDLNTQRVTRNLTNAIPMAVALLGLSAPVFASTHPSVPGIQVISAAEVLREHTETGPDGTLMSFSLDYQFTATPPVAGARYGVVVQRRDGRWAAPASSTMDHLQVRRDHP